MMELGIVTLGNEKERVLDKFVGTTIKNCMELRIGFRMIFKESGFRNLLVRGMLPLDTEKESVMDKCSGTRIRN